MTDIQKELIGRIELVPHGHVCTLTACEPGFFLFGGNVFIKSEYGESDSYCESGEVFWGGVKTKEERNNLVVQPLVVEIKKAEEL